MAKVPRQPRQSGSLTAVTLQLFLRSRPAVYFVGRRRLPRLVIQLCQGGDIDKAPSLVFKNVLGRGDHWTVQLLEYDLTGQRLLLRLLYMVPSNTLAHEVRQAGGKGKATATEDAVHKVETHVFELLHKSKRFRFCEQDTESL